MTMKVHNTRSPEQWKIIHGAMSDWKGKQVIDLGFGYGDILTMALQHGAHVIGVDRSSQGLSRSLAKSDYTAFYIKPIEEFIKMEYSGPKFDVAICFSVLPYLDDPFKALAWLSSNAKDVFIEWQYVGDGPGDVSGDGEVQSLLSEYWLDVSPIGKTFVEGRNKYRTIWHCRRDA